MKDDNKKKNSQLIKRFHELMLILEGGDKRKNITFDC